MTEAPYHPVEFREGAEAHYRDGVSYDRRYRSRQADIQFYVELARRYGGPVLELGVGTGRIARRIAEQGIEVVGVDGMQTMLQRAEAQRARSSRAVQGRLRFEQGDLRSLRLGQRFPLVTAPFNVFMHLYTREDVEQALASVRRHLSPGGRLAFDVSNPDPRSMARDPTRLYKCRPVVHPMNGERYDYSEAFHYDRATQVMHVSMILEHPNNQEDVQISALSQRQFFPAELESLLHYNGFVLESLQGGFGQEPLTSESESLVVVATLKTTSNASPDSQAE